MDIVFICEHYHPEIGGLERSTERLAIQISSNGHIVQVVAPHHPNLPADSVRNGIRVIGRTLRRRGDVTLATLPETSVRTRYAV